MNTPPNRYVQPDVSEARIERLWQNVAQRLDARPRRAWRWAVLCTALAGAAAGGVFWFKTPSLGPSWDGNEQSMKIDSRLETKSDELSVTLGDGSSVKLGSQSAVEVRSADHSSRISLTLARGELWCDVTHRETRKFKVVAGDVEVRVVGTQFSVKTTAGPSPRVEVSVTRGVVEVVSARRPGVVARVAGGQSWIQDADSPAPRLDKLDPAPAMDAHSEGPAKHDAGSPPPIAPGARELFEKAGEIRRAGDAAAAARVYEELLRLHPSDGRASLAAFELGRLRMDRLGDLSGAIVALERSLAMNIGSSFREDALARLVSVYASQGNLAACRRARNRYASSYPAGVHAAAVATRCGSD